MKPAVPSVVMSKHAGIPASWSAVKRGAWPLILDLGGPATLHVYRGATNRGALALKARLHVHGADFSEAQRC